MPLQKRAFICAQYECSNYVQLRSNKHTLHRDWPQGPVPRRTKRQKGMRVKLQGKRERSETLIKLTISEGQRTQEQDGRSGGVLENEKVLVY